MTARKPTVKTAQVEAFIRAHPVAFGAGAVGGYIAGSAVIIALCALQVFIALNLIAGFGLNFAQVVGIGLLLYTIVRT